jgi:hypothetical protein
VRGLRASGTGRKPGRARRFQVAGHHRRVSIAQAGGPVVIGRLTVAGEATLGMADASDVVTRFMTRTAVN